MYVCLMVKKNLEYARI